MLTEEGNVSRKKNMGKEKSHAVQKTGRIFPSYSVPLITLFLATPAVGAALGFYIQLDHCRGSQPPACAWHRGPFQCKSTVERVGRFHMLAAVAALRVSRYGTR